MKNNIHEHFENVSFGGMQYRENARQKQKRKDKRDKEQQREEKK